MDLKLNIEAFEKKIDSETGSILYYKRDAKGLPDKVLHGEGYTIEIKDGEVMLIDIYNPSEVMTSLVSRVVKPLGV